MKARFRIQHRKPLASCSLPDSLHAVVRRVYANRKLSNANEIEHRLELLHHPESLAGLDQAVELLRSAVETDQRILIVGDFDADGATSTALAIRALRSMGATQADYLVPDRFKYGYGLTPEIVRAAVKRKPDILVTVDNGISSIAGVAAARAQGIQVIVTDHHLQAERLPDANAIVNPTLTQNDFPSKCLAGVGVIFYVMLGLRTALNDSGWFTRQQLVMPNMAQLLDIVALGTVADVVPLDHNNRILVAQGLMRIRAGQCVAGITALLRQAKRNPAQCIAGDLGFAVAPRLNAAGRLEDMSLGIECLLADDRLQAEQLAQQLDELNVQRREIEADMRNQAGALLAQLSDTLSRSELPAALSLYDERWHQGVIGILASRIKDRVHRPVIAFAKASATELKGSARSIPGLHIRDALDAVAARHPELISKFGGHAMAAGLSIELQKLPQFQTVFAEQVEQQLETPPGEAIIWSDGELSDSELALETAEALRQAGPWGQGFAEPMFDGIFQVKEKRIVGESHLKMILQPKGSDKMIDAIAFNETGEGWNSGELRVAYRLDVNEFRDRRSLQLNVQYLEPEVRR
ncbi:MAG: single-stranded-DNA-specific exonuclease RecJ [Gammaproteobacteria bacterium]|nr:single-stranded-DNA-specific exonuclease RecJ [Gammaproteobacteria bacterium]